MRMRQEEGQRDRSGQSSSMQRRGLGVVASDEARRDCRSTRCEAEATAVAGGGRGARGTGRRRPDPAAGSSCGVVRTAAAAMASTCEKEKGGVRERGRTRVGREGRGAEVLICRSPATRGGARQGFGHAAHGRSWHPRRGLAVAAVGEADRAARLPARTNSRRPALERWCSRRGEGGRVGAVLDLTETTTNGAGRRHDLQGHATGRI